jgi:phosphatidylglycerol lysyltransferase
MELAVSVISLPPPPQPPLIWRVAKAVVTVAIVLFLVAGLQRLLGSFDFAAVVAGFQDMPLGAVVAAIGLLSLQQAVFIVQETAAAQFAGKAELGLGRIAVASLVCRSLSSLGLGTITGFALRWRVYGAWGLDRNDVTRLSLYNESTYLIGIVVSVAAVFTFSEVPAVATASITLPPAWLLGGAAWVLVGGYVIASLSRTRPLHIRKFEVPIVRGRLLAAQLILPVVQMIVGGALVWVCLPDAAGLSLPETVTACFVASLVGSISQVPGGLGVFETVVLQFAPPETHPAVLASLLVRRVIVNLLPIILGTLLLVGSEVSRRPQARTPMWTDNLASALSVTVFVGGVILVLTASLGALTGPFARLGTFAHTVVFAIGCATLVVARGLHHRLAHSWRGAVALLALRFVIALASGPEVLGILTTSTMLIALLVCRRAFTEARIVHDDPFAWHVTLVVALIGVGALAIAADTGDLTYAVEIRGAGILIAVAALVAGAGLRRLVHPHDK